MPFLTRDQLLELGFKSVGREVKVSDRCSIYGADRIEIGDYSRIDDFTILSAGTGGIKIGRYVHIACFTSLIGKGEIVFGDFSTASSHCAIYSSSDDYSGRHLTNPTVAAEFTNVTHGPVILEKHVIVGAGAIILPNVHIGIGTAIGAMSFVTKSCEPFGIYVGVPAKRIKERSQDVLERESAYLNAIAADGD